MIDALLSVHLIKGSVPVVIFVLGALALIAMLVTRRWRQWLPIAATVLVCGAGLGFLIAWILGDLLDLFGVTISLASRAWLSAAVAGVSLAVARMLFSGRRAIIVGVASALILALAGGMGINADLGEFPTVRNALGIGGYRAISLPTTTATSRIGASRSAAMPAAGRVGTVTIPATVSHFRARQAILYLPPAALVPDPQRLPVLVMLSGQPGSPSDLFTAGQLGAGLDGFARAHRGLAPIVIVPDQLGAPARNPMCVDSALGDSATYVTVDVVNWVKTHLAVLAGPAEWGIGGFSQGGTCAIQFGAARPDLFGTIIDIAGEVAPRSGSLQNTIDTGFAGSRRRYVAAIPADIMRAHGRYHGSLALFCVGADDARYARGLRATAADAATAGMTIRLFVSPGTAHDWRTVQYGIAHSLPLVAARWGLGG